MTDHHAAIERAIQQAGGPENIYFIPVSAEGIAAGEHRFTGTITPYLRDDGLADIVFKRD